EGAYDLRYDITQEEDDHGDGHDHDDGRIDERRQYLAAQVAPGLDVPGQPFHDLGQFARLLAGIHERAIDGREVAWMRGQRIRQAVPGTNVGAHGGQYVCYVAALGMFQCRG